MTELAAKIGLKRACDVLGVARSTVYRARQPRLTPQPSVPQWMRQSRLKLAPLVGLQAVS